MAVAHSSILVTAYSMLKHKRHYKELGAGFFDSINRDKVRDRLVQRLAKIGFNVTLKSKETLESAADVTEHNGTYDEYSKKLMSFFR